MWILNNRSSLASVMRSSYRDPVLVKRVDVEHLGSQSYHSIVYTDHSLVPVHVNLNKTKVKMAGYRKLNVSLFSERHFQEQLLLILKQELTLDVICGGIIQNPLLGRLLLTIVCY